MNEGIAKALRRKARSEGYGVTAPGRGTVIPGKETKALWRSLTHRQRGEWRKQLPQTRAARRKEVRDAFEPGMFDGRTLRAVADRSRMAGAIPTVADQA